MYIFQNDKLRSAFPLKWWHDTVLKYQTHGKLFHVKWLNRIDEDAFMKV
jgi:hypothetical protein